jgi:hypothetical protein
MAVSFIECTSLNISYDILGVATITYTVVTDTSGLEGQLVNQITAGGQTFSGYITNASISPIPQTEWYEINATLIATTN